MGHPKTPKRKSYKRRKQQLKVARSKRFKDESNTLSKHMKACIFFYLSTFQFTICISNITGSLPEVSEDAILTASVSIKCSTICDII